MESDIFIQLSLSNPYLYTIIQRYFNCTELSRRTSLDGSGEVLEANVVLVRERKLVPEEVIKGGMCRLTFLLETCPPGSLPDAQLMAAILDLVNILYITWSELKIIFAIFILRLLQNI